jgi:quercetin dioxygenase-like cupin family protein
MRVARGNPKIRNTENVREGKICSIASSDIRDIHSFWSLTSIALSLRWTAEYRPTSILKEGFMLKTMHFYDREAPDVVAETLAGSKTESAGWMRHSFGADAPQCHEVHMPPGFRTAIHAHLEDEIVYVVGGELIMGQRTLGPGSSVYIPGNTLSSRDKTESASSISVRGVTKLSSTETNLQRYRRSKAPIAKRLFKRMLPLTGRATVSIEGSRELIGNILPQAKY